MQKLTIKSTFKFFILVTIFFFSLNFILTVNRFVLKTFAIFSTTNIYIMWKKLSWIYSIFPFYLSGNRTWVLLRHWLGAQKSPVRQSRALPAAFVTNTGCTSVLQKPATFSAEQFDHLKRRPYSASPPFF